MGDAQAIARLTIQEDKERILLTSMRQAVIMMLGSLEDYLDMERSIVPRHKREENKACRN